ncbi:MAG: GNAT family N-acetyltransferase [Candidatus Woesearchaeota archaeon]
MRIAALEATDAREVFGLLVQLWPHEPLDEDTITDALTPLVDDPSVIMLVARDDGCVVGFARGVIWYDLQSQGLVVSLTELVVDEALRRQGIGTRLLDEVIEAAKDRSCVEVRLTSTFKREAAHTFYASKGFTRSAYLFWKEI